MVTTLSVTRYLRQFRLLPKTVIWLEKQLDAAETIDCLVAKTEAEEQNAFLAARGRSGAEEELEVCYEQIETLKQELKHQAQLSDEYLQELEYSHGEIKQCNQELMKVQKMFLDLHSSKNIENPVDRLAFRRGDLRRNIAETLSCCNIQFFILPTSKRDIVLQIL